MTTTMSVSISGYVSGPYEQVCRVLETWKGDPLSVDPPTRPGYLLGHLVRVSSAVARLPVGRPGPVPSKQVAELRVLPVITGREDPLTEVLLVTEDDAMTSTPRSMRVQGARSLLDALVRKLDAALASPELTSNESEASPLAS